MMRLCLVVFLLCTNLVFAQEKIIPLYEGKALGSELWNWEEKESIQNIWKTRVVYNVSKPTLTAYLPPPESATGTAVIIAPGGAFHTLSIDSEGIDVAKWLNSKGVAAFVLKYRVVKSETDDPVAELAPKMADLKKLDEENSKVIPLAMADGLAAVKYVRSHAREFDIDPARIGFIGFSAGGTLTMSVVYSATPENRPNFVAPIYAYAGAIIGSAIPKEKTPIFIAVAGDDQLGFTSHSIDLYTKWQAAGQPAELHVYEKGGHGFGMRKQKLPTDTWYERFGEWMKLQGYLTKLHPSDYEKQFSEEEREQHRKDAEERQRKDWANLKKYEADNKKLASPKLGENRVVFLGNSITEGWVNMQPEFFANKPYIGRGISGQTSPQTLVRFRQDVLDLKPAVVIINIGTNDIAENTGPYNPDFTFGNIVSLAELAKANNIRVIIASVLPAYQFPWRKEIQNPAEKVIQLNQHLKEYALKNKLVYLDYHTAMKDERNGMKPEFASDGIHPTLAGYKIMAVLAEKAIAETLKTK